MERSIDAVTSIFKHCSTLFDKWLCTSLERVASDEILAAVGNVLGILARGEGQDRKVEDNAAISALTEQVPEVFDPAMVSLNDLFSVLCRRAAAEALLRLPRRVSLGRVLQLVHLPD